MTKAARKPKKQPVQRKLTEQQKAFAREYLIDLNATAAARRAGYSERSASEMGYKLLNKPLLRAFIDTLTAERAARLKIDADQLLQRLVDEADADLLDIHNDDGSLKQMKDWPLVWRQGLVAGVEVEEVFGGDGENRVQIGVLRKIKLSDRVKRLELIGRHRDIAAWKDRKEVQVDAPLRALFDEIAGRGVRPRE